MYTNLAKFDRSFYHGPSSELAIECYIDRTDLEDELDWSLHVFSKFPDAYEGLVPPLVPVTVFLLPTPFCRSNLTCNKK